MSLRIEHLLLALVGLSCGWLNLNRAVAAETERPNVVFVLYDDESWLEASAYGNASIETPNFDRVAREGVLFTHAYASAPSCAPARASLLTGRHFWELEQGAFIQGWLPDKFPRLPDLLDQAGYHTGYTGKGWGPGVLDPSGPQTRPAGKSYRVRIRKPEEGTSNVDYVASMAEFLKQRPAGAPFYFWVGCTEPHHPHGKDNYKKLGVDLDDIHVPKFLPDTPGIRRHRANYLYEVRHADNTLGGVLKLIEEMGELENTLVIVTGDNGTPVPRAKANVYDWGVRVPLAMMWPARIAPNRRVKDFANFADFAPTILDAAGAEIPKSMSGRSLLPVLLSSASGQVDPARTWTVAGLEWHGRDRPARMIRDHQYQYIVNYYEGPRTGLSAKARRADADFRRSSQMLDVMALVAAHPDHPAVKPFVSLLVDPRPREELYDCLADPWQLNNLANRPELAEVKKGLREKLEAFQRKTNDPRITGDMALFDHTRAFVTERKRRNYKPCDTSALWREVGRP